MAKVLGLGGVFFKSQDREQLAAWYEKWLGFSLEPNKSSSFAAEHLPAGAYSVWSPFAADTKYLDPGTKSFMINLIVDDLDGMLARVKEGGGDIVGDIEEGEYGRFGWFMDPEGNKVELWQCP
ncbi:MAG: VOC family protein [Gemmatimonadetes bacterium]|nr:VOC family protein [Gemmatimonadota bacterium]